MPQHFRLERLNHPPQFRVQLVNARRGLLKITAPRCIFNRDRRAHGKRRFEV